MMTILMSRLVTFNESNYFGDSSVISEIGWSLKTSFYSQVKLFQIPDTHGILFLERGDDISNKNDQKMNHF